MRTPLSRGVFIFGVIGILVVSGCASSFQPGPMEEVGFQKRAQTQSEGNIRVTAAVLSAAESEAVFGVSLYNKGIQPIWLEIDWENLYAEDEIIDYDEAGLRRALENLPCCATNKKGTAQGDPLNLVVIGDLDDVYYAFMRAGWDETETIYRASVLKTIRSFLFGGRYRCSPVSALSVFGRAQDVALQPARTSIHERNHLRLWLAPMGFEGKLVWIGQISRDIGVRFTRKTITTHKIDPDVDETRNFLIYTGQSASSSTVWLNRIGGCPHALRPLDRTISRVFRNSPADT